MSLHRSQIAFQQSRVVSRLFLYIVHGILQEHPALAIEVIPFRLGRQALLGPTRFVDLCIDVGDDVKFIEDHERLSAEIFLHAGYIGRTHVD